MNKKKKIIMLFITFCSIFFTLWFGCNPFYNDNGTKHSTFNELDNTDVVKATGVTDPFSNNPIGFASLNGGTTGGKGGQVVTVTTLSDLKKYANATEPYIIKVSGTITCDYGEQIWINSNKTIVGVGTNATIVRGEFRADSKTNIIIRNLTIRDSYVEGDWAGDTQDYDGIQLDYCSNVWIDHNHITHMGDGLIDLRNATTYVTVSWNIFSNHNKAFGIGWTDNREFKITIHHNYFKDTNQRNPSFDNGMGHIYNNYFYNIASYGCYSRGYARVVLENSYFENVNNPYYPDSTAQLVAKGITLVNCTGKTQTLGTAFNPSSYYSYLLDSTSTVPDIVRSNAGPSNYIVY